MYFCKNCGEAYVTDEAIVCVKCGAKKGTGVNFCHHCGKPVTPDAQVCMTCGVSIRTVAAGAKSKIAAGLLGIFLGYFGVHNFYLGYTGKAVTQLVCTILGFVLCCIGIGAFVVMGISIWGLVEGIMILTGNISTDADGNLLAD